MNQHKFHPALKKSDQPAAKTSFTKTASNKPMVRYSKTMEDAVQLLSKNLSGWCTFINDDYRFLVIAPPKCGSTSILKALYDKLVEPSQEYEKDFSHEYTKELCIHKHLKNTQDTSADNLRRILSDSQYKKILVTRDPVDRLCSAICSKYLIEKTPHHRYEILNKERLRSKSLRQPYKNPKDFLEDFNEIAYILMTKGSIFNTEKASHASPIVEIVPQQILPLFNEITDITNGKGWTTLKNTINNHLEGTEGAPYLDNFAHINENPLSNTRRFLSVDNLTIANRRYSEDFANLKFVPEDPGNHKQCHPSHEELKSMNIFISLTTRTIDIFMTHSAKVQEIKTKEAKKNSDITIKNKQLVYLEELSRRTAEQLLIESDELKAENSRLISLLEQQPPHHKAASALDSSTLIRRAEKRIRNKNLRSARELLLQAYSIDQTNQSVLLRLFAASIRPSLLRSLLLLLTRPIKKGNSYKTVDQI